MPTCVRCGEWSPPSGRGRGRPVCGGALRTGETANRLGEEERLERSRARYRSSDSGGAVFVLLEPLLVGVASLVASAAAGYLAGSVLVFLVAAVAGFVWGLGWFFLVGGVILRRWPNVAFPVGFYGGPVVAVGVAAIAAAGYWWVAGLGLGVTVVFVGVFWLRAGSGANRDRRGRCPMPRGSRCWPPVVTLAS